MSRILSMFAVSMFAVSVTSKGITTTPTTTTTAITTATVLECTGTKWGVISIDSSAASATVHMTAAKTELELTGLKYNYEQCVNPKDVTLQVFEKGDKKCGTTSLGTVVKVTSTRARKTAHMGLKIDGRHMNEASLGKKAYRKSTGPPPVVTITVCVHASVKKKDGSGEVTFREDILSISYTSVSTFSTVEANVVRKDAGTIDHDPIKAITESKAYHCNNQFQPVSGSITQEQPILRVCITGNSSKIACKYVASAILRQPGNGNTKSTLISNGRTQDAYTEIRQRGTTCMVQKQLTGEYFEKTSASASLGVVVSGSAHMEYVERRRLRRLQEGGSNANTGGDAEFDDVSIAIGSEEDHVSAAALTTAYGIAIGVIMVIATLM